MPSKPTRRTLFVLAWAVAGALLVALAARIAFDRERADIHTEANRRLVVDAEQLRSALTKFETLPFVVSLHPLVSQALIGPSDREAVQALDRYLVDVQQHAHLAAAYVVEPSGLTIAASNWNQSQSFVGNNYRFRPYVRDAIEGRTGHFYGIGTTTGEPGYFLAKPVFESADSTAERRAAIGAVVIKLDLQDFEKSWPLADDPMALIDVNGVAFLSNVPDWKYRSLDPLSDKAKREIVDAKQYDGKDVNLLVVPGRRWAAPDRVAYPVGALGWKLVRFVSIETARRSAWNAALSCGLLVTVAGLLVFVIDQRRRHQYVAAVARQALVEASARLEDRIAERTHDLVRANADLQNRYRQVKDAQQLLHDTQVELIQAGKLGMLGQMAAGVTHELNQPLTAMRVFADNAMAFIDLGDLVATRENLGHIADAASRMGHLVGQLKTFARKSAGVPGPVDLANSIENSARLMRSDFAQCNAALEIRIDQRAVVVGDAIRVEQVLINLMRNALDAVKPCAIRRVRATLTVDGCATVRIDDTGPGITPQVRERLFEPFFTTKPSGAGLGLGLAISSSIVQAMNGELLVTDGRDGGAEFILKLPLAQETGEDT
jgi:two-component system C4-dicarboxylate transport sensor histidine kinase DctB